MADDTVLFRLFVRAAPDFLDAWRPAGEGARLDLHYLLSPDYSLRLTEARRVELDRVRITSGFRSERRILNSAFPLDGAALAAIGRALPPALRGAPIDGRTTQGFVETMALPGLPQARVFSRQRRYWHGTTVAEIAWISVADWRAETMSVQFECGHAPALTTLLRSVGLGAVEHRDLDDWLRAAYHASFEESPVRRRTGRRQTASIRTAA